MKQTQLAQEQPPVQVYRAEERIEARETAVDATLAKEVVADSRRQRRRILRGVSALLTSWVLLYTFLWLYETVGIAYGWPLMENLIAPFLFTSFLGSMALAAVYSLPSRRQKQRLRELARTADLASVGPMVDMLGEIQPRSTRRGLVEALTALLPRLKESDALLLSMRQRAKLHAILEEAARNPIKAKSRPDLTVAILQCMGQVGDERSLRFVRRLANIAPRTSARARIRGAAQEALDLIQLRLARDRPHSTLLRAASVLADDSALLRPVGDAGREPEGVLLRAPSED